MRAAVLGFIVTVFAPALAAAADMSPHAAYTATFEVEASHPATTVYTDGAATLEIQASVTGSRWSVVRSQAVTAGGAHNVDLTGLDGLSLRFKITPGWADSVRYVGVFGGAGAARTNDAVDGLLTPEDFRYVGSFKVSNGIGDPSPLSFSEGGTFLAYSTTDDGANDGFPGSLWISARSTDDAGGMIGRISIPVPSASANPSNWPTAAVLDAVSDFAGAHWGDGQRPRMGDGALVVDAEGADPFLVAGVYDYYEGADADDPPSIFTAAADPAQFSATRSALLHIGEVPDPHDERDAWVHTKHSAAAFTFPRWWRRENGEYLALGQGDREGGYLTNDQTFEVSQTVIDEKGRQGAHMGPGFALVAPESLIAHAGDSGYEIPAMEAAAYRSGKYATAAFPYHFSDKDSWVSAEFVSKVPNSKTLAPPVYGDVRDACAVVWLVEDCEGLTECYAHTAGDPYVACPLCCGGSGGGTGYVCSPPLEADICTRPELWLYRLSDFEHVLDGAKGYYYPTAYAFVDLSPHWWALSTYGGGGCGEWGVSAGGVTFDHERRLLYVCEQGHTGCCQRTPFIHVYAVGW